MESVLYSRVKQLCRERGVSVTRLESDLGLGVSTIQKWKASSTPNANTIMKVAQYLNVSTDFLLGNTNISATVDEITSDHDIISLQRARSRMSPKDRDRMMQMLKLGFEYAFRDVDADNNLDE